MKGTIIQRGSKWAFVVDLPRGADGKRRQKWYSGYASAGEARADRVRVLAEIQAGVIVNDSQIKLGDYLGRWLNHIKAQVRPSTWSNYSWAVGHIAAELGGVQLSKLRPLAIQDMISAKLAGGLSGTSSRYLLRVLSMALAQAVEWDLIRRNPCGSVMPPRLNDTSINIYDAEQCRRLMDAAGPRYLPVALALSCGLRRGEVCGLRWRDVYGGSLYISNTLSNGAGLAPVKSQASGRAVSLPAALNDYLEGLRAAPDQFVWSRPEGGAYDPLYLLDAFKRLCRRVGVPVGRFHDLRHTHATLLLLAGVPLKVVSERLGHSSPAFTAKQYQHVLPSMQQAAARSMNGLFGGECLQKCLQGPETGLSWPAGQGGIEAPAANF